MQGLIVHIHVYWTKCFKFLINPIRVKRMVDERAHHGQNTSQLWNYISRFLIYLSKDSYSLKEVYIAWFKQEYHTSWRHHTRDQCHSYVLTRFERHLCTLTVVNTTPGAAGVCCRKTTCQMCPGEIIHLISLTRTKQVYFQ